MKKPSILIAIPFKGKTDLTIKCLESLTKSYISGFTYEILLVSDGSTKEELEYIYKNNPYRDYSTIIHQENIGYCKTVYNIVNYAEDRNFDFLLLSNNDIIFFPQTVSSLVKRILSNYNISVVGCKILHWIDDIIIHTGTRIDYNCENWIKNPYCGLDKNNPITDYVERRLWVNGCCCLYNLSILKKEHMNFNLEYEKAYFEECDLMTRLNLKGYSVLYEPRAIIRHRENGTTSDNLEEYYPIFKKNWNLYLSKWKKYFNSKKLYFQ